jgi:hypothetical protein
VGKQSVTVRLDSKLVAWVDEYAKERGVSRTVVFECAVGSFRGDARRGVPDLGGAKTAPGPVRINTVVQAAEWAKARQARLNSAKERAS